ncbi:MAG TPA: hypothetical protein VN441_10825 [Syntrophomonas sp.]|nr:hypothetical protein [Syntrophomonas sp.]
MSNRIKTALAALLLMLLTLSPVACGGGTAQNYAKATDLPEDTTLLLLTDVKRASAQQYAVSAKAGKVTAGTAAAIGEQSYTFLLAPEDTGDSGGFYAYAWEPGAVGLTSKTAYNSAADFMAQWFSKAKEYGYSETAFNFTFNENGAIDSLSEFADRSGANGSEQELPYWHSFDFGPNLAYAEEYEIPGDPGEYMNAAAAAKQTFDSARRGGHIPGYNGSVAYTMTLIDLADINGEECYVYRCDGGAYGAGYAYAYQSGNIYMQGQDGQWVQLDIGSTDPADVNWWGEYNSINYVLGIANYNGTSFYFSIDDEESGVAALEPDNPYSAQYGEMVFTFDGIDTISITGGDYAETYYRAQN